MATTDALTLDEAKELLGIDGSSQDTKLQGLIGSVTRQLERRLGTHFVQRSVTEEHAGLVRRIYLNRSPIVSVTSITDPAGYTVPSTDFVVREKRYLEHWGRFWQAQTTAGQPTNWTVVYVAGWFADQKVVDELVKSEVAKLISMQLTQPDPRMTSITVDDISMGFGGGAGKDSALLDPMSASITVLADYMGRAL